MPRKHTEVHGRKDEDKIVMATESSEEKKNKSLTNPGFKYGRSAIHLPRASCVSMHNTLTLYAYAEEENMRTTLDLPEKLLNDAMKITHSGTKTGVIVLALKELIRKSKIAGLKKYRGKIDLDIDLDEIRDRH